MFETDTPANLCATTKAVKRLVDSGQDPTGEFANLHAWLIEQMNRRKIELVCEICENPHQCVNSIWPCDLSGEFFDGRVRTN